VVDALNTPATGLSPQRAMEVARAVLPRNTIATCDAGASRLLVVQKWQSYGPREFLTSNGLGSMGYAVPGALGARLAHPDRPVVAFTGDGGFLMAVAELQTSMRENLPIVIVVLDDQQIGLIRVKQEIKGIPLYGVSIGGCDWEKLAQGFGADGTVVDTEKGLGDALGAAIRSNRTTVIGVRIDPSGYVAQFNALREL
jgi:acetolactate synthase-1/2/3 large subunit